MYDIFVIGGGINGCGVARDAAGRGYSVYLAEMNDLGSGTSSWSTKLVHGGLRYLEHYEFRLVREALMERELLWASAPHIIWPLRFVLPHHRGLRPVWLLRLGLFLYDHLGGRKMLPPTRMVDLTTDPVGKPLKGNFTKGFEYSDCWVNDARLVVLNARDAAARGAVVATRTQVVSLQRDDTGWTVTVEDGQTGRTQEIRARLVVNAAGPWVDEILRGPAGYNDAHNVRLVQGSHIVVRRMFEHDRCYIFQNEDGRIIFAIPYEQDYTLIGTTDRDYEGDPADVKITEEEKAYLCGAASEYFRSPVRLSDIVWTYSGVRPLFDDGASKAQEATRDYVLKADDREGSPLVNIFGGKITTYRRLSEAVLEEVARLIGGKGAPWTSDASLPGGDFPMTGYEEAVAGLRRDHDFLPEKLARRLVRAYGTDAGAIIGDAESLDDMGPVFGADLSEAEVRWLMDKEWARTADDILWRRSKLGLKFTAEEVGALEQWLDGRPKAERVAQSG